MRSTITVLSSVAAFTYLNMGAEHVVHPLIAYPVALTMFAIACCSSTLLKKFYH